MVSLTDDVEVVLDDNHGVTSIYEFTNDLHQDADIVEMQTSSGFIEDIERAACIALRQFRSQLYTLTLAARECRRGLSQFDIAQTNILDGLDFTQYFGHILL